MSDAAVHWHDGMFLSPHHFQAADRHHRRALREAEDWFHPHAWGVRSLRIDDDAVGNGQVKVLACEARFRDGTHLRVGPGCDVASLSLDLHPALKGDGTTMVALAVRAASLGTVHADPAPSAGGARFWTEDRDLEDENGEAGPLLVRVRRLQPRLLHVGQDATGYETLPLLRVQRSGAVDAVPRVVNYVPPLLCLGGSAWLVERVEGLVNQVQAKASELAEHVASRGLALQGHDVGEAERLLKLAALNQTWPPLRTILATPGLPPWFAYLELTRALGRVGLFLPERTPPALLPYDHEDIAGRFAAVIDQIRRALQGVERTNLQVRHFSRDGNHLRVALDEAWLQPGCRLYLGIETDRGAAECDRLLTKLDRSIGSATQVEELFDRRVPGLSLQAVNRLPAELVGFGGVTFFEISQDKRTWAAVARDRSLGIRLNMDQATFQSAEVIRLTTAEDRGVNLRFAVYVIPAK